MPGRGVVLDGLTFDIYSRTGWQERTAGSNPSGARLFMIIHTPELLREDAEICVRAVVEPSTDAPPLPEALWFRFPPQQENDAHQRADGFAVALLLVAMELGEDIEVRGVLSPRLLYGMHEFQRFYNRLFPERFKRVDIHWTELGPVRSPAHSPGAACAFSGGVDSFYTLWSHLPENETVPGSEIGTLLFCQGVDVGLSLKNPGTYETALEDYSCLARELGLRLLTLRTNARVFTKHLQWYQFLAPALIGTAHVLSRTFTRFYVGASTTYGYSHISQSGSDSRIDHLLSSEALEVVHDGAAVSRATKHAVLVDWPVTHSRLRVCSEGWRKDGVLNCGRCEKCVRGMATLEILGALRRYTSFTVPLTTAVLRQCRIPPHRAYLQYWTEIVVRAWKAGQGRILMNLLCPVARCYVHALLRAVKHRILGPPQPKRRP